LVFIDYAATAWYDIHNEQFDSPIIRGTTTDYIASYLGINKHYSIMYGDIIYKIHSHAAVRLLNTVYQKFSGPEGKEILQNIFKEVIDQLNQIIDESSLEIFWKYIVGATTTIKNNLSVYENLVEHLTVSFHKRIQYIPTFLRGLATRIKIRDE